jgi:hypothetical protein
MDASSEEKSNDSKDSFCEELDQVFEHFSKYNITILLGDINEKLGRENIFKPIIRNESVCKEVMIMLLE